MFTLFFSFGFVLPPPPLPVFFVDSLLLAFAFAVFFSFVDDSLDVR